MHLKQLLNYLPNSRSFFNTVLAMPLIDFWHASCMTQRLCPLTGKLKNSYLQHCLLWILNDLFEILNGEQNKHEFTFKKKYKFIRSQKQLIFERSIPSMFCLCDIFENTCLIAKTIRRF